MPLYHINYALYPLLPLLTSSSHCQTYTVPFVRLERHRNSTPQSRAKMEPEDHPTSSYHPSYLRLWDHKWGILVISTLPLAAYTAADPELLKSLQDPLDLNGLSITLYLRPNRRPLYSVHRGAQALSRSVLQDQCPTTALAWDSSNIETLHCPNYWLYTVRVNQRTSLPIWP